MGIISWRNHWDCNEFMCDERFASISSPKRRSLETFKQTAQLAFMNQWSAQALEEHCQRMALTRMYAVLQEAWLIKNPTHENISEWIEINSRLIQLQRETRSKLPF